MIVGLSFAERTAAAVAVSSRGADGQYVRKLQQSRANGSPHPVLRILSVAKQIWVIGLVLLVGLVGLVVVPTDLYDPTMLPTIAAGLGIVAVLIVVIDAFKRRCPKCRTLLAGDVISIVRTGSWTNYDKVTTSSGGSAHVGHTVHTHGTTWRCVHCGARWGS